jgi:Ca2+-binding RTX toxin-like protein
VLIWNSEQVVLGPFQENQPNSLISGGDGYDTLQVNTDVLYFKYVYSDLIFEGYQPGPFVSDLNLYHNIYGEGDTYIKLGNPTPEDAPGLFVNLESIERIEASGVGPLNYINGPDIVNPDDPGLDDPHPLPDNFTVVGTIHDDSFRGAIGNEVLIGGAGNDTIGGGFGADRLEGGIGADHLEGGAGQDTVAGGPDADLFLYKLDPKLPLIDGQKASGLDGNDIILDFSAGEHDVVRLDAYLDMTPDQANGISNDANEILVKQTAESVTLTFGGNGATLRFDTLGINDIGAISGNTLQALESTLISISGDSAYDPFQFV